MPKAKPAPPSPFGALRLVHPLPAIFVTAVTVAMAVFAEADVALGVQLGAGMLLFLFSIGAANDVVDAEADRRAGVHNPVATGQVPRDIALRLAVLFAAGGLMVTFTLPTGAWLLGAAGLLCGQIYSVSLKRSVLSWLPMAVALPLVPTWVFVAADAWDPLLWWTLPLGAAFGIALHLAAKSRPVSKAHPEISGIAAIFGVRASRGVALGLFGVAGSVAVIVMAGEDSTRAVFAAAVAGAVAVSAMRIRAVLGRGAMPGLLAVGSAAVALFFVSVVEV